MKSACISHWECISGQCYVDVIFPDTDEDTSNNNGTDPGPDHDAGSHTDTDRDSLRES